MMDPRTLLGGIPAVAQAPVSVRKNVMKDARKRALAAAVAEALGTEIAGVAAMIVTASMASYF